MKKCDISLEDRPVLTYAEHRPSPPLDRYVERWWTLTSGNGERSPWPVHPDGCIDILFDLHAHAARFIGTMTRTLSTAPMGQVDLFGIRFRPAGIRPIFGPRADAITDRTIPLDAEWRDAGELLERLAAAPSFVARRAIMERALLDRIRRARREIDPAAEAAAKLIRASGGKIAVKSLEQELALSARQLERKLRAEVGVSPKRFARIVRVQRALALAPALRRGDWAEAALELGFSDQAHLIRELRAMTGLTPTALGTSRER